MNYDAIHEALNGKLPIYKEWKIIEATNNGNQAGSGLFLIPKTWEGCPWLLLGDTPEGFPIIGNRKVIFELFRLTQSGRIKLSARCRYLDGVKPFASYDKLRRLARSLGCPSPKNVQAVSTKSVATWPIRRPYFKKRDYKGIAEWLWKFLSSPPKDFDEFIKSVPHTL